MGLYIQGMSSCACQEIVGVSYMAYPYDPKTNLNGSVMKRLSGEELMVCFCRQAMGDRIDVTKERERAAKTGKRMEEYFGDPEWKQGVGNLGNQGSYAEGLGDTYVFHGPNATPGNLHTSSSGPEDFAAYIKEAGLGHLAEGIPVKNERYHPTYTVQAFVWNPDRAKLIEWWAARNPRFAVANGLAPRVDEAPVGVIQQAVEVVKGKVNRAEQAA